ncbi:MAG: 30S ribosomal protein S8 [Alphaproteobacteria bacterium]|jgi:small subunit ribosomal protein S8
MSLSDPLGDMLTRIRNGLMRGKDSVSMPASRFRGNVLDVLHREGYIRGFKKVELDSNKNEFKIELKYVEGEPVIKSISRVSTPGRRVYSNIKDLQRNFDGLGISILSTSKGVLSDHEARTENVGGEILCKIF